MASKDRSLWTETYRRRVERAEAAGKTRQQARGHIVREHVRRRERELAKKAGQAAARPPAPPPAPARLTPSQRSSIRRFANEQFARSHGLVGDPDQAAEYRRIMMEYAEINGYSRWSHVRAVQREAQAQYRQAVIDGTYSMLPAAYTIDLWAVTDGAPDTGWYFYH